ncbi:hypothetical protein D6_0248 [Aeromonas phage D6]|uniref:Uncharacterized protein n=2 Tax=Ludhianavirus TaxID=3044751 RepID=A0A514A1W3_9CAUD|nr:hypothetical protein PQC06_gp160 [Aeromonas phage LAh10]YP_010668996.1 hypothetical protein PQC08_gp027 [Aeromonas phage D6]QDH47215.1 hypothetical protein LAh10_160 [Aeromonas phage LAh10]QDJ97407.1 hypothetical protein D6_0248 [Aeromonas phage D6]
MGGVNPLFAALLELIGIDVYDTDNYQIGRTRSGNFTDNGNKIEYAIRTIRLGGSLWVTGTLGSDVVELRVVEPGVAAFSIGLPNKNDAETTSKIEFNISFTCEEDLRTAWRRVEGLFSYAG